MRKDCDLVVYVDVPKAIAGKFIPFARLQMLNSACIFKQDFLKIYNCTDGIKFFWSENGVLLTAGNAEGKLLPKYFSQALRLRPTSKQNYFVEQLHLDSFSVDLDYRAFLCFLSCVSGSLLSLQ